jgi:Na+/phosphate symporter
MIDIAVSAVIGVLFMFSEKSRGWGVLILGFALIRFGMEAMK